MGAALADAFDAGAAGAALAVCAAGAALGGRSDGGRGTCSAGTRTPPLGLASRIDSAVSGRTT
jgi:hypothetical protein